MESFVIRIYRRSEAGNPAFLGTVEAIATGKRSAFHDQAEMLALLDVDLADATQGPAVKGRAKKTRGGDK